MAYLTGTRHLAEQVQEEAGKLNTSPVRSVDRPSGIEIRPYHPPTALNAGYSQARQRTYLSATLGSMDDLQRRVGGGKVTRLVTEQPLPTGSTGERMFVLNPSQKKALDPAVIAWAVRQTIAAGGRAAWLCASHPEAEDVQMLLTGFGHDVYRLRAGDDSSVDAWSRAPLGHLVTAGRYDGLDLAGDVCKLVVITTVPQSSSEFERLGVNLVVVTPDNVLTLNEAFAT
ncbi:hypothetical protein AB0J47_29235 [Nocardia sp. NPDC049737]|uniref:hypothetical protein n=1 Tax=Nocardia sp. NPDC049737 TaxID=3154358 RepID=UPI00341921AB